MREPQQPPKLRERIGVILDADVKSRAPGLADGRHHDHRRGLSAAHVAARVLGRVQGMQQPLGEGPAVLEIRARHRLGHSLAGHHVRLAGEAVALHVARVRDAAAAGECSRDAACVHHAELAVVRELVGGEHRRYRGGGVVSLLDAIKRSGPVCHLGHRLGRCSADPGLAQATTLPTENQCDCTATPISPVDGSRATIE